MKKAWILLLSLLCCRVAWADSVTAQIDRPHVALGETLQLILTRDSHVNHAPSNLQALTQDFRIIGTTKLNQFENINGKSVAQTQWILTLMPKKTGHLSIPALIWDQLQTQPQTITVDVAKSSQTIETGSQRKRLFLDATVEPLQTYV